MDQLVSVISMGSSIRCCSSSSSSSSSLKEKVQITETREKVVTHVNLFRDSKAPASVFGAVLAIPLLLCSPVVAQAATDTQQKAANLFNRSCIGCHDGGGNIIQPAATLFLNDLHRNGVDTEDEIYRVTYFGKGRMPGFGEMCTPRGQCTFGPRLQDDEIKLLAEFVKLQADQNWPSLGSSEDVAVPE